jgi:hypothetical protein
MIDNSDANLEITSPFISIVFDNKALRTISEVENGGNLVVSASIIDNEILSDADKSKVQKRPVYDLTVKNGANTISDFNGGHARVTIPYTLEPDGYYKIR